MVFHVTTMTLYFFLDGSFRCQQLVDMKQSSHLAPSLLLSKRAKHTVLDHLLDAISRQLKDLLQFLIGHGHFLHQVIRVFLEVKDGFFGHVSLALDHHLLEDAFVDQVLHLEVLHADVSSQGIDGHVARLQLTAVRSDDFHVLGKDHGDLSKVRAGTPATVV